MCKCTPSVRTPFCGSVGCTWPDEKKYARVDPAIGPDHAVLTTVRRVAIRQLLTGVDALFALDEEGNVWTLHTNPLTGKITREWVPLHSPKVVTETTRADLVSRPEPPFSFIPHRNYFEEVIKEYRTDGRPEPLPPAPRCGDFVKDSLCPVCRGSGREISGDMLPCKTCGGVGRNGSVNGK